MTDKGRPIRVRFETAKGPKTLHVGAYARGRLIAHQKRRRRAGQADRGCAEGRRRGRRRHPRDGVRGAEGRSPRRRTSIPRAERLVYRKPGEQLMLTVNPDKSRYAPGGKVRLELSAVNEKTRPPRPCSSSGW